MTREELAKSVVEGRLILNSAAASFKLSRQSAGKWVERYRNVVSEINDPAAQP